MHGVPVVHPPTAEEPVDDRPEFKPDASDQPPGDHVSDPYHQPEGEQPPQQPPQQQPQQPVPGYGQPPPQQWQTPPSTADGLDPKVGGLLAYLFGWLGGLIIYLTQKNPEVRFHGAQSILLNIALFVIWFGVTILTFILPGILDLILGLGMILIWIGAFVLWIILLIKAYNLEHYKLPVIGDMAEGWAAK